MREQTLTHHGVLGMRWGVRKDRGTSQERKTRKIARKDAKRYVDAKMFYGDGAGIQRRHLKAELKRKMKDPAYSRMFDEEVARINQAKSVNRAKRKRHAIDTGRKAKRIAKKVGRIAGPLAVTAAGAYYKANKQQVDRTIRKGVQRAYDAAKSAQARRKFNKIFKIAK